MKTDTLLKIIIPLLFLGNFVSCGWVRELDEFMANPNIRTPDLMSIKDSSYIQEFQAGPIKVKTKVTVKNHQITECVLLKHRSGRGKPAGIIVDSVVREQSLNVDAITGATLSSTVILKTIQLALEQGLSK